jgi:hypothetical protein
VSEKPSGLKNVPIFHQKKKRELFPNLKSPMCHEQRDNKSIPAFFTNPAFSIFSQKNCSPRNDFSSEKNWK